MPDANALLVRKPFRRIVLGPESFDVGGHVQRPILGYARPIQRELHFGAVAVAHRRRLRRAIGVVEIAPLDPSEVQQDEAASRLALLQQVVNDVREQVKRESNPWCALERVMLVGLASLSQVQLTDDMEPFGRKAQR